MTLGSRVRVTRNGKFLRKGDEGVIVGITKNLPVGTVDFQVSFENDHVETVPNVDLEVVARD
jgi:hypothetical protein|tara:strand:+ start:74 stop:259 length:186 start_codon:yes stop_codon:yes gene_type:complete